MQTLFFAGGALLVALLIMFILPLGFTMKGKILIALSSFVLALGGIAAVSVLSLWQTGLMLLALVLISAYVIDKRLGALMYQESSVFEEDLEDETIAEAFVSNDKKSSGNIDEVGLSETLSISLEKEINKQETVTSLLANLEETAVSKAEEIEDDISFLLEHEQELEVNESSEDLITETSYLADIESLLELETETNPADLENTLEELDTKKPISV